MLLAKTLTSSTFRVALIAIGAFGVIVSAIFGYVYQDGTRLTVIGDREVLDSNTVATRRETVSGSLVAAVARIHGARIEMYDNAPGLKLTLQFSGSTS